MTATDAFSRLEFVWSCQIIDYSDHYIRISIINKRFVTMATALNIPGKLDDTADEAGE